MDHGRRQGCVRHGRGSPAMRENLHGVRVAHRFRDSNSFERGVGVPIVVFREQVKGA